MKDYLLPCPLHMELLRKRYDGKVSLWSFGGSTETEIAYTDEYVARGFMVDGWFNVTSCDLVLPLSPEKQRLNGAIELLQIILDRDLHLDQYIKREGFSVSMRDAIRNVIGEEDINVYR